MVNDEKDLEVVSEEDFVDENVAQEANPNVIEDLIQEEAEGPIEEADSELDQIGFEDEDQAEAEKLTLRKIKEYNEVLEQKERVEFYVEYNGKKELVYITVDKSFTKSNIIACLQEYMKKIDVLRTKKIEIKDGFMEMYMIFQIIKHFTDLEMPKSIENQLVVMERLINTGLLFQIFTQFPQEEIDKLLIEVNTINETLSENFNELEKQLKGVDQNAIQNGFIKEQVKEDIAKVESEAITDDSKE